jgi:hypothetical protein
VIVPVRGAVNSDGAALQAILPPPLPEAAPPIVNHGAVELALQVQPLPVITVTVPVPPSAVTVVAVGDRLNVQDGAGVGVGVGVGAGVGDGVGLGPGVGSGVGTGPATAASSIRTVSPATVTSPVLASPAFGATVNVTDPDPL